MPELSFQEAIEFFQKDGFYRVHHPIVLHHLMKDFADYEVENSAFFIKPVGEDFLHIAVIEYETRGDVLYDNMRSYYAVQIRYTCAGDDLLYGLRTKFNSGGSTDPRNDIADIEKVMSQPENYSGLPRYHGLKSLANHPRYVRKRFRQGRTKAKIRALFVMLSDFWKLWRA